MKNLFTGEFIGRLLKTAFLLTAAAVLMVFSACGTDKADTEPVGVTETVKSSGLSSEISAETSAHITGEHIEIEEEKEMKFLVDGREISVIWEENESVDALRQIASNGPLNIQMSKYGGFEQVGYIGTALPKNDRQMTTSAGDIVLYSGNQLVVFYGSNSWAYTRLGKITGITSEKISEILGNENVNITITSE